MVKRTSAYVQPARLASMSTMSDMPLNFEVDASRVMLGESAISLCIKSFEYIERAAVAPSPFTKSRLDGLIP